MSGIEASAFSGTLPHLQAHKQILKQIDSQINAKNIQKITKICLCMFDRMMIRVEIHTMFYTSLREFLLDFSYKYNYNVIMILIPSIFCDSLLRLDSWEILV